MIDIQSLDDCLQQIRDSFQISLDKHIELLRLMYFPFTFSSSKDSLTNLLEKHNDFLQMHQEGLSRLLQLDNDSKLEFKDDAFEDIEAIEHYCRSLPDGQHNALLEAFLRQQRILSKVSPEELNEIKIASAEGFEFELTSYPNEEFDKHKISFLLFNSELNNFIAFFSNDKVVIYDHEMYPMDSFTHTFGTIVCADSFEGVMVVGNSFGKVSFLSGTHVEEVSTHHFSA